jgi:hypothetical protein
VEPFVCGDDGNYGNAEVFSALGLLGTVRDNFGNLIVQGQTPEEVRTTTLLDLMDMARPDVQTMAMMQVFPNLMNFSKTAYGYEHYLVSSALAGSSADSDGDGVIDEFAPYLFKMYDDDPMNPGAVNAGLLEFKGFNQPMFLPPDYDWYPPFDEVSNVATMKLPDGKFMKLFLGMQLDMNGVPMETIQQLIGSYPAFSNGVTLGGHGVVPNPQQNALGGGGRFDGCQQCHTEGGVLDSQVPVTKEQYVQTPMGMAAMPVYKWKYYNIHELMHLGVSTSSEDVVQNRADIDIDGDRGYVRESAQELVLNWFQPTPCGDDDEVDTSTPVECFLPADSAAALARTDLDDGDLTWSAEDACGSGCPEWMPVLEPVTNPAPNYAVLGYARDEVIWDADDPRINPGPPGGDEPTLAIEAAVWTSRNARLGLLGVEGNATPGDRVEIINGVTGQRLFLVRTDPDDGSFDYERYFHVRRAPCTVAPVVDDLVGEAVPVDNAPEDCVGAL